jgi:flagellar M-ring protein FliF
VRYGVALLSVILVLLIVVRPLVKAVTGDKKAKTKAEKGKKAKKGEADEDDEDEAPAETLDAAGQPARQLTTGNGTPLPTMPKIDAELLGRHVGLAQQIVQEKPESALMALRQMLQPGEEATT